MKPQLKTSIQINIPLNLLVVEKSKTGLDIAKGSHIYCGLCGKTIGRVNANLQLPMPHEQLFKVMTGVKATVVNSTHTGLYHTCGNFLFTNTPNWVFIGYDEWKRQTDQMTVEAVRKALKGVKGGELKKPPFLNIENEINKIKSLREERSSLFMSNKMQRVFQIDNEEKELYKVIYSVISDASWSFRFIDEKKEEYIATGDYSTWWTLNLKESGDLILYLEADKQASSLMWAAKKLKNIGHFIPNNVLREWVNLMHGSEITTLNKPTID